MALLSAFAFVPGVAAVDRGEASGRARRWREQTRCPCEGGHRVAASRRVVARERQDPVERYEVREVRDDELYVVSDIRVTSFYDNPADSAFMPTRRREIFVQMRKRLHSLTTTTFVVLDNSPPDLWKPFTIPPQTGQLLLGSLDAFLFDARGRGICPPSVRDSDKYYISSMAVRNEFRGLGLGKRLLCQVLQNATRLGVQFVYLHVDPHNTAAHTLYTSQGFMPASETEEPPQWLCERAKSTDILLKRRVDAQS